MLLERGDELRFVVGGIADQKPWAMSVGGRFAAFDESSTADTALQQTFSGEVGKRLAQRLGVDVEAAGQFPFAWELAREFARCNCMADTLPQTLKLVAHSILASAPLRCVDLHDFNPAK